MSKIFNGAVWSGLFIIGTELLVNSFLHFSPLGQMWGAGIANFFNFTAIGAPAVASIPVAANDVAGAVGAAAAATGGGEAAFLAAA